ncbi:MAG: oxaloacetate decarboxylase [Bacteroidaceae bacterium]|nr:oxaloacetate decarboxylase [Bacteroidaceae bacterium]MBQ9882917.1 oxaloacetate decarboxylase [Bacteroidaceae bacterium]MBR2160849.1 oxaloacetate decarboxylase [Bacteroidaceae bacterium]MBR3014743.1 oxaloacetate decarboxylase [Bacteroidaceae bacterium]MBR3624915.1 oxaloacetate decarboxylase [Bacteroidaceae bacterium]
MKKEIKFSLVYRDMFQSSGKFQPRVDQLVRIAPVIIDMGCFDRVETNGGAFEQVNLMYGENPNKAVRAFTKPFNEVGIKTHMLDRGLNALRMYPCPVDVRKLMYKVKHAQGVDITRIFDGLNDANNIIPSIKYALEGGMTPQATLCITYSPIHTVEYYTKLADKLIEAGAQEICLKDMAGIGRPWSLGQLTKNIKERHPEIVIQYHGHSGPGLSVASMLEVAEAGADVIDVAIEPLSWGKVHPDVITIQAMLKDAGFLVKDINMKAYMQARALTQEFIDDFLGYFMDPTNKHMSSLLLKCGLPGGMMGSMMADMKGMMPVINMSLKAQDKPEMTLDEVVIKLFDEVEYVWPKVGYPPLVTPFSQYVKNIALMNILAEAQGKPRYSLLTDKSIWGMILGKSGHLPGEVAPEIKELAKEQGLEFFTGDVQALYPDNMDDFRKEMKENGWETGPDDEELFEFAMHPEQYRPFKSGVAKERFEADLQKAKDAAMAKQGFSMEDVLKMKRAKAEPIEALEKGQILWEIDREQQSIAPTVGTKYKEGDHFCYIQTPWGLKEIFANFTGKIIEVCVKQGETADKGDALAYIERTDNK